MQHSCPKCSSGNVDRVPVQHVVEQLNTIRGWRMYRCRECETRFEDVPSGHTCPQCLSGAVTQARKESFGDLVKGIFGWAVYHCRDCGARFHDRPLVNSS